MQAETEATTRRVIERFYEAALQADFSALAESFHPDIASYTPGSLPNAGVRRGRDAVMEFLPGLFAGINLDAVVLVDILVHGERAAVFLEVPFGAAVMPIVEAFIVTDGLITEVRPYYFDTAALLAG